MAKITRKQFVTYLNVTPSTTATYFKLGEDLEEMNTELNNNVEEKTNILGESSVNITKGNPVTSVDPIILNSSDDLYTYIQDLIDNNKELDDLITDIIEVKTWETPVGDSYPATKRTVKINIQSYGGDTNGYQAPFQLHEYGSPVDGDFDIVLLTFTAT